MILFVLGFCMLRDLQAQRWPTSHDYTGHNYATCQTQRWPTSGETMKSPKSSGPIVMCSGSHNIVVKTYIQLVPPSDAYRLFLNALVGTCA